MQFDRSKFKKTSLDQVSEMTARVSATMGTNGLATQFAKVVEGENIFRVMPAIKGIAYAPLKVSKLKVEVPVYDKNGQKTGSEIKDKNIFCADVHGVDILKGKDPIITYISYVNKLADDIQDKKERERFLTPIQGTSSKNGWVWGIAPILSYVCYVTSKDFEGIKRLQLRSAWLKRMREISVDQSEDDTLCVDIFSGADDGYPLKITATKNGKKTEYSVSAVLPKKTQSWDGFFEENSIPDETLEKLSELPALQDLYINSYRPKDFKMAVDGLKRLDEEAGYGIFADDSFLNELEEMAELLPDDNDEEEIEHPNERKPSPKEKQEKKISSSSQQQYPPLIKMKSFLRDYIEREYEGTETLPDLSVEDLRKWYDLAKNNQMLPFPTEEGYDDSESENEPTEEDDSPIDEPPFDEDDQNATRERVKALRERLANRNK